MIRPTLTALALCLLISAPGRAEDADAKALAQSILDKGAEEFSRKDAKAMASFYAEDGELYFITKDGSETKTDTRRGRREIEEFYANFFKDSKEAKAKNTVEYARFLGDDTLLICGIFQPDNGELKLPFVQYRTKKGNDWLITNLRVFLLSSKS